MWTYGIQYRDWYYRPQALLYTVLFYNHLPHPFRIHKSSQKNALGKKLHCECKVIGCFCFKS